MQLVFWNETTGDWDGSGVFADNATILASGNNCTFVGYTTHFTLFTIGSLSLQINVININNVRSFCKPMAAGRNEAH